MTDVEARLRAELPEIAANVSVATPGSLGGRRSPRRVVVGTIAAVVVIALVVAVVSVTRSSPNRVEVTGPFKKVGLAQLAHLNAAVVLPTNATSGDVSRLQHLLDRTSAVERYAALPVGTLAGMVSTDPRSSAKALRARVCAAPATESFAVELSRTVPNALRRLTATIGLTATLWSPPNPVFDIEVFMRVNATAAQVGALREKITTDPEVISDTFVNHQAAYRQYLQSFANQSILVPPPVSPRDLPESFELDVRDGASLLSIARRFRRLPGVFEVNYELWATTPAPKLAQVCSSKP